MIKSSDEYYLEDNKSYFLIALGFHILFIGVPLTFYELDLLPKLSPPMKIKKEIVEISSAVRVDVVGMPKYTLKELKKLETKIAPAQAVKEEPKEVVKEQPGDEDAFKEKGKKLDLSSLLKNVSSRDMVKQKKKELKAKRNKLDKTKLRKVIIEGNKIHIGNTLIGDKSEANNYDELASYGDLLKRKIREFWKLPSYLQDKGLSCRVQLFYSQDGKLTNYQVIQSSGNPDYDKRALAAIDQAMPVPVPDSTVDIKRLVEGGLILAFPL